MSLASILPVGGAALGLLAARTLSGLSAGLSFPALLAGNGANPSGENTSPASVPPATIDLEQLLPKFAAGLRQRLQDAGVDSRHPLTLKGDGNGGVVVDGEHPDRAAIEQVFRQDTELMSQFQELAGEAAARRQANPFAAGQAFGEFRLSLAGPSAAIHFD